MKNNLQIISDENFDKGKVLEVVIDQFNDSDKMQILLSKENAQELQKIINENPIFMKRISQLQEKKIWDIFALWKNIELQKFGETDYIICKDDRSYKITGVFETNGKISQLNKVATENDYWEWYIKYKKGWFFAFNTSYRKEKVYIMKNWQLMPFEEYIWIYDISQNCFKSEFLSESIYWIDRKKAKELLKDRVKINIWDNKSTSYYYNTKTYRIYEISKYKSDRVKNWKLELEKDKKYIDLESWEIVEKPQEETKITSIETNKPENNKKKPWGIIQLFREVMWKK